MISRLLTWLMLCTGFACQAQPTPSTEFTITGDLSSYYTEGTIEFIGYPPKKPGQAARGLMSMGAAPEVIEYAKGEVRNGKFKVKGNIDQAKVAYILVRAENQEGRMMAPTKGLNLILEPGELNMVLGERTSVYSITGGERDLNQKVLGFKQSPEYLAAQKSYFEAYRGYKELSDEEKEERSELASSFFNEMVDVEFAFRSNLAATSQDKEILMLSLQTAAYGGSWMEETKKAIIDMSIDDPAVRTMVDKMMESNKAAAARANFGVGSPIKYFYAETLEGEAISMYEVCQQEGMKYVLLEFWASWCGPCRAEVPNMKEAYEMYKDQGFEIFAFSIDNSHQAWAKASQEEQLPWVNSGFGTASGPKDMYGVTGVPANYLIEVSSGSIVAKNLRGTKLKKKLEELLANQ